MGAPATLPADFFSRGAAPAAPPPDKLPADFFSNGGGSQEKPGFLGEYFGKVNPVTQAQGVVDAAIHPAAAAKGYGEQNAELWKRAQDAFGQGDYTSGAAHLLNYFLNGIPGVGAALDEAGQKFANGDYEGGAADTAALATNIFGYPAVAKGLSEIPPGAVAGAAKGAVQGGAELVKYHGRSYPIPASVAGAMAGHYAGSAFGPTGSEIGATVGAFTPIVRGAIRGWKGAVANNLAQPAGVAEAAAQEAAELDAIAMGQAGKKFAKLTPEQQTSVRTIYDRINAPQPEAPPAPAAAPPAAPAPAATPATEAAAPISGPINLAPALEQGDYSAAAAATPTAPAKPVRGLTRPQIRSKLRQMADAAQQDMQAAPAAPAAAEAPAAAPSAPAPAPAATPAPSGPAAELADLIDPERKLRSVPEPAEAAPHPKEVAARDTKATKLAQFLYNSGDGIPKSAALLMDPQQRALAAKGAGITEPSVQTWNQAMQELEKLETPAAKPAAATPRPTRRQLKQAAVSQ